MPKAHETQWPEPFDVLLRRTASPPQQQTPNWTVNLERMFAAVASNDAGLRNRAFTRLYFLHLNGWLNGTEQAKFAAAVWINKNVGTGLPQLNGYYDSVVLDLPVIHKEDVSALLKHALLGRELQPLKQNDGSIRLGDEGVEKWMFEVASVFRHPAINDRRGTVMPLEVSEVAILLDRLLLWLSATIETVEEIKPRAAALSHFTLWPTIHRSCTVIGESLLFYLPRGHKLADSTERVLHDISEKGISVLRASPGRLFQTPEKQAEIVGNFARALISTDVALVTSAARAITSWQRAAIASLVPPVDRSLIGLLVSRLTLRQMAGLDAVINCLAFFVSADDGQIDQQQEQMLLLALDQLSIETESRTLLEQFGKDEIQRDDIGNGLHIRSWAGLLASKLTTVFSKRGNPLPDVLKRWRTICENDTLPEVRNAWGYSQNV